MTIPRVWEKSQIAAPLVQELHSSAAMGYTPHMQEPGGGLRIRVAENYEAMSREAAAIICAELRRKPTSLLCASAGGTPTLTYQILTVQCARAPHRFKQLRVLQIDEWAGLPRGHPATCAEDLRRKVLRPLLLSSDRFTGFRTDAPDREAECRRVARWLDENRPIDVCLLGLGRNGHVAMNEPAEALTPRAHVARLAETSRQHPLLKDLARKPTHGLTLGMTDILRSRKILLLVNSRSKRAALKRLMRPQITARFPASFLWLHPDATVLCDREAISDVGTS